MEEEWNLKMLIKEITKKSYPKLHFKLFIEPILTTIIAASVIGITYNMIEEALK